MKIFIDKELTNTNNIVLKFYKTNDFHKNVCDRISLSVDEVNVLKQELENVLKEAALKKNKAAPPTEDECKRLRTCIHSSALVRFLHEKRLRTAAITHYTSKAFRLINMDLGVTWIPLNILRWSETAKQYVVVDGDYQLNFTKEVAPSMDIYPTNIAEEPFEFNDLEIEDMKQK